MSISLFVRKSLSLIFSCFLAISLFSQTANDIYLEYDGNCLRKYEYRTPSGDLHHYDYHFEVHSNVSYIFRVDVNYKYKLYLNQLPRPAVNCNGLNLRPGIVRKVNDVEQMVFIVKKQGSGYELMRTTKASYKEETSTYFKYITDLTSFTFYKNKKYEPLENIEEKGSVQDVYYANEIEYECSKKYNFKKFHEHVCVSPLDFQVIPGIGIVRETTNNDEYKLKSVDGMPLTRYHSMVCEGRKPRRTIVTAPGPIAPAVAYTPPPAPKPAPAPKPKKTIAPAVVYTPPAPKPAPKPKVKPRPNEYETVVSTFKPAPVKTNAKYVDVTVKRKVHIVSTGETLFSIAQHYGLSVTQLKLLNKMDSNMIKVGQQLFLSCNCP